MTVAAALVPILTGGPVLAAVAGGGVGLGLFLMLLGLRGVDPDRPPRVLLRRARRGTGDPRTVRRLLAALAVAVVCGVLTGWVVGAVLAGLACWSLPRVLGADRGHARRVARIEAIASWAEMLRDTLSAASGLEQAILATAPLAPRPIQAEVSGLAARLRGGARLPEALRATADELGDPIGDLVIAALVLAAEQQARQLADLLGSLARTAREQAAMRLRIEAGRARSRTSVRVIVGTTVAFAVGLVVLNRPYLAAYDTPAGQVVLLAVGAAFWLGVVWLTRIATIPEPPRFLSKSRTTSTDPAGRDAGGNSG